MAKERPILTIKGDLVCRSSDMFPRPGKVNFGIEGGKDEEGKVLLESVLSVRRNCLPEVATVKHVRGRYVLEFFEVTPDSSEYAANVAAEASIRKIRREKSEPEAESGKAESVD